MRQTLGTWRAATACACCCLGSRRTPGTWEVTFVRTLTGKSIALELLPLMCVIEAKQALQEVEGSPSCQQRLVVDGKQLADGCTLGHYNIHGGPSCTWCCAWQAAEMAARLSQPVVGAECRP